MPPARRGTRTQIADELRARIESGELAPGDVVPGENPLAEQYGVAKMTARAALAILKDEGLLEAVPGKGTQVRLNRPLRRRSVGRLASGVWQAGRSVWAADTEGRNLVVDQIQVSETPASAEIARILGVVEGEDLCVRSRRYVLDGKPIKIAVSYLQATLVAGTAITDIDTGPGGIYARLAEINQAPVRFVEEIRGRLPSPPEIAALRLTRGASVLEIARTAFTASGSVVELNTMVLDAASHVLEYAFDA
jgi:GntR family transcriptional regulator